MKLITILGPTASGKTAVATELAYQLDAEIISADSRQVYRGMDLGTGKDLNEYTVKGKEIPHHLIDIVDAGYKYNLYEFQQDFAKSHNSIIQRNKPAILCGGTGLYIESVLKGYQLVDVPENTKLRQELASKSLTELNSIYKDILKDGEYDSAKRAIRAIEIVDYQGKNKTNETNYAAIDSLIIGLDIDRDLRREKISKRLKQRFEEGMINEVQNLLKSGIAAEDLIYYGLEYKYITLHCTGQLSFEEMHTQLEVAIHQFAKRQMTWFRGMERRGYNIHWIKAELGMVEKTSAIKKLILENKT